MTFARHVCVVAALAALAATPSFPQQNDQQVPPDRSRPVKVDPSYQKLADETGGTVFVFDREFERTHPGVTGAAMAAEYVARRALVATHGQLSGYRSVDATLEGNESKLVVTATGGSVQSFELRRPSGSAVVDDGSQNIYAKLGNGGMFVISHPEAGTWTAVLSGEGNFSLSMKVAPGNDAHRESPIVTASTPTAEAPSDDIEFDAFEFQHVAGRPAHEGLFKIDGYPVAGRTYPVEAKISGSFSTVRFEFRAADGQPLQTLDLKHDREQDFGDRRVYTGEIVIPAAPFRIYATGLDQRGQRYQRVISQLVRPQSFAVESPGFDEWQRGQAVTSTFTVTNYGEAAEFEATVVDTAHLLRGGPAFRFSLAAGESRPLDLTFDVPIASTADADTVVVTVVRGGDPSATNHAVFQRLIVKPD